MSRARFWLRWSIRDLRERWILVLAIALTIAIGTGAFAGMASTSTWRRDAIAASVELLRMHDLRLELAQGAAVPTGTLRALVEGLDRPDDVAAVSERLVVPVAVDASTGGRAILVPGLLVGVELAVDGPPVDGLEPDAGRALGPADAGAAVVLLEHRFARFHGLPPEGTVTVAGREVRYVGQATTPEMLVVTTESGAMFAEASFAGVFAGLETAQDLAGTPGMVNDLVLRVRPGADRAAVADDLRRAAERQLPAIGTSVATRDDDAAYRVLTRDVEGDARFFNLFAALVLLGAAFATFNLTSRIVEAQRRQIGIGMALGMPDRWLALRPLLVGAEIAVAGIVLGVGVGLLVDAGMLAVLEQFYPLPVFEAPLLPGPFLAAAAVGFLVPFGATLLPVWTAIRMPPVEAIHAGPRSVRGSGLARLASHLPLPGGTLGRAPVRNVLRSPRRSILTSLAIGAAIGVLVAMAGMIDTFEAAIRAGESEMLGGRDDRVTVELAGFVRQTTVEAALAAEPTVGASTPGLRVGASVGALSVPAGAATAQVEVLLSLAELRGEGWRPTVTAGAMPDGRGDGNGGLLLAEEAARDLGVGVGDQVRLRHPRLTGGATVATEETVVRVAGLHPNPVRTIAFMDIADADMLGLAGMVNTVDVEPAAGSTADDVIRAVFGVPGVVSAQPAAQVARIYGDLVEEFIGILAFVEGLALLMALLVAFNSASIATDERAREHATMLAFGVPVWRVIGIEVAESVILGIGGTLAGLAVGVGVLAWFVGDQVPQMMPDLGIAIAVAPGTIVAALAVGVIVVGIAPVFMARRLRRMNLPGTLRLVE
ncbi:MAG TPA: FtsX-like permease family protein [Candidatus Limnocylindrales bacterium]|nr:FtsX-like permease family protein [Candidatus Limnocylindrales bacterium]